MRIQLLWFLFFFCIAPSVMGQAHGTIQGQLMDAANEGEPLLFAQVTLKGTSIATQTDFNGNFELVGIPTGDYVVQLSYLGYESKEVRVTVQTDNPIYINESINMLSTALSTQAINASTASNEKPLAALAKVILN